MFNGYPEKSSKFLGKKSGQWENDKNHVFEFTFLENERTRFLWEWPNGEKKMVKTPYSFFIKIRKKHEFPLSTK